MTIQSLRIDSPATHFTGSKECWKKVRKTYKTLFQLQVFHQNINSHSSEILANQNPGTFLFRPSYFGKQAEGIYFVVDITGENHRVHQHRFLICSVDSKIYNVSRHKSSSRITDVTKLNKNCGIDFDKFYRHVYVKLGGRFCLTHGLKSNNIEQIHEKKIHHQFLEGLQTLFSPRTKLL